MIRRGINPYCLYAIHVDGIVRYYGRSIVPAARFKQHIRIAKSGAKGLFYQKLAKALLIDCCVEQQIIARFSSAKEAATAEIAAIARDGGHEIRGRQLWN